MKRSKNMDFSDVTVGMASANRLSKILHDTVERGNVKPMYAMHLTLHLLTHFFVTLPRLKFVYHFPDKNITIDDFDKRYKAKENVDKLDGKAVSIWSRKNRSETVRCSIASRQATARYSAGNFLCIHSASQQV